MKKLEKNEKEVQLKISYRFKNIDLLHQAFTRSSFSVEYGTKNNELLEFIGDSILNYYTIKKITNRYKSIMPLIIDDNPLIQLNYLLSDYINNKSGEFFLLGIKNESTFDKFKKQILSNKNLSDKIDQLGFAEYLYLGKSDLDNKVYEQEKVKADLFEAIIGAVAIDSNWNDNDLENTIESMLHINDFLQNIHVNEKKPNNIKIENAINILKELSEHGEFLQPRYSFNQENKEDGIYWKCICKIYVKKPVCCEGYGSTKKIAKQYAAYKVLCEYYNLPDKYQNN